jgi:hypothetical protein
MESLLDRLDAARMPRGWRLMGWSVGSLAGAMIAIALLLAAGAFA